MNLKIGQKLILGSGMLCVLAGALAWIGYREILILRAQLEVARIVPFALRSSAGTPSTEARQPG